MTAEAAPGLLCVLTNVDPQHEQAWNQWYDTRHVPQLLSVPGFLDGSRYTAVEGIEGTRKYLALYNLASGAVYESEARKSLSRTDEDREMLPRFKEFVIANMTQIYPPADQTPAHPEAVGALLVVGLVPEPEYEEEYNAWYDEEHIPELLPVPGVLRARRFRALEGVLRYLAIYELSAPEVRHSEAFEKAIDTPWSARMRRHCARPVTAIYRPLGIKG